jgi:hypothetical protein
MLYCIRQFRDTTVVCPPGESVFGVTFGRDTNSFDFEDTLFGLPNPIIEAQIGAWMVSYSDSRHNNQM